MPNRTRIVKDSPQSVSSRNRTQITFDTAIVDDAGWFVDGDNAIQVDTSGLYLITLRTELEQTNTGDGEVATWMELSAHSPTEGAGGVYPMVSGSGEIQQVTTVVEELSANEQVTAHVFHSTGSIQELTSDNEEMQLEVIEWP